MKIHLSAAASELCGHVCVCVHMCELQLEGRGESEGADGGAED